MTLGADVFLAAYILFFGGAGITLLFGRLPEPRLRFFRAIPAIWYKGLLRTIGVLLVVSLILNLYGFLHSKL